MGADPSENDVMIRIAVVGDADAIGDVHVRAWQAAYRGVMPDEYLDGLQASERADMWRGRLARTDLPPLLVPMVDGDVVGFATFGAERRPDTAQRQGESAVGELYAINLHPHHWGKGIGRALLRRSTDALVGLGFQEAVLWVVPQNTRARGLYEAEGWAADGAEATDEILGVTVSEVRYRRTLTAT